MITKYHAHSDGRKHFRFLVCVCVCVCVCGGGGGGGLRSLDNNYVCKRSANRANAGKIITLHAKLIIQQGKFFFF